MARISKSILVLAVTVCCALLLGVCIIGSIAEAQPRQARQIEHPQQEIGILVEAFVVEVRLSALYDLGVSPIGKKPNSVSVDNILECLGGKDLADVTTGVKVALHPNSAGTTKVTETIYVERQSPPAAAGNLRRPADAKSYVNYNVGWTFASTASIRPNGRILVQFDFSQSTYKDLDSGRQMPPDTAKRDFSGAAYLDTGEPAIVGAVQDEEAAVFLILCARRTDG
ncbi:MAG: hypothetical protein ACYSWQ_03450 [Planctomycetota bacterium]|jgi:hypothetical protein